MPLPFIIGAAAAAAAGYGAKKGYDGYKDKSEAEELVNMINKQWETAESDFKEIDQKVQKHLENIGELQLKIGTDFVEFRTLAESLLGKLDDSTNGDLKIELPKHQLDKIVDFSISATDYLKTLGGAAVGAAASAYAVYGGVMALGAASTGTPIAALAGAAAQKAALAALGGGSLAAGGGGIALGQMVLAGAAAAPVLAIAGFAYAKHGEKALENAQEYAIETSKGTKKLRECSFELKHTDSYLYDVYRHTEGIYDVFKNYLNELKDFEVILRKKVPLEVVKEPLVQVVMNGFEVAAILTDIITTPLFKIGKDAAGDIIRDENGSPKIRKDENGIPVINKFNMEKELANATTKINELN